MKLSIRPLKLYRDNLNNQGKTSEADKVQAAIRMLQTRNSYMADGLVELAKVENERAMKYMRDNNIPFGQRSVKGERTSWITDAGQFTGGKIAKCGIRVCVNWKGYLPTKMPNPHVGKEWDKYENGKRVGVRG